MTKYHDYFEQVRTAFKKQCDEIKEATLAKLKELPEEDKEGRKAILIAQKEELDKILAELKQLLNHHSSRMRASLEAIRKEQDEDSFDLEGELEGV